MKLRNVAMTRQDWASWARLCKRFPEIKQQVDHCAALMAAQSEGRINVLISLVNGIGGWTAAITGYSHHLEDYHQTLYLNRDPEYPRRFKSLKEATEAAIVEKHNLLTTLELIKGPSS